MILLLLLLLQDLERQNETLQDSLRKYHQDQRALLDKVNVLQQQLTQVRPKKDQPPRGHKAIFAKLHR